jgi:hypothetical protein
VLVVWFYGTGSLPRVGTGGLTVVQGYAAGMFLMASAPSGQPLVDSGKRPFWPATGIRLLRYDPRIRSN